MSIKLIFAVAQVNSVTRGPFVLIGFRQEQASLRNIYIFVHDPS